MEENKIQRELMSEEEFKEYISNRVDSLHLVTYEGVGKYKSVKRAIKRGNISPEGFIIPSRPFHNRKNSCKRGKHSRAINEDKKRIYASIKSYRKRYLED